MSEKTKTNVEPTKKEKTLEGLRSFLRSLKNRNRGEDCYRIVCLIALYLNQSMN